MLVIGNGESRKCVDINLIVKPKIACNAAYRDLHVDYLVCLDQKTLYEAATKHSNIYTRQEWHRRFRDTPNIHCVPDLPYKGIQRWDDPWHWGSGPYAVLLAAELTETARVDLIGFDLYSADGYVNNVYKDTENYAESKKRAVDPRYWIYQIAKVFELYPNCEFRIHQTEDWEQPVSWKKSNVEVDTISMLAYNNNKRT